MKEEKIIDFLLPIVFGCVHPHLLVSFLSVFLFSQCSFSLSVPFLPVFLSFQCSFSLSVSFNSMTVSLNAHKEIFLFREEKDQLFLLNFYVKTFFNFLENQKRIKRDKHFYEKEKMYTFHQIENREREKKERE